MKTIFKIVLLLSFPIIAQAQRDTIFAEGFWTLPTIGGLQCEFKFDSIEVESVMFNPHKFYGANYQYQSEYQICDGYGNCETYPTTCSAWVSMNFENTAYSSDTIEILGYFWNRVDAVDFKMFTKKKNRAGEVSVNASPETVQKIACGCYKKIGRSKVVIDWIRKEPVKIDRA
jgi:hypothetical protein